MPISAAGSKPAFLFGPARSAEAGLASVRRSAEHGFTLVELMIVITIIGLSAAVVAFVMPDPRGRVLDEGLRLAARTRAARNLAIVESQPISLWVTSGGYGFDRRVAGAWTPVADKPLRVERWPRGRGRRWWRGRGGCASPSTPPASPTAMPISA